MFFTHIHKGTPLGIVQIVASMSPIICALLVLTPYAAMGGHLRIYRHDSKPFLDGDFLRDSSNPLDVYEDMQITTPAPDSPPAAAKSAGKDEKKDVKDEAKAAPKEDSKGTDTGKNASASASAVQMKKTAALRADTEVKAMSSQPTAAPAVAKKEISNTSDPGSNATKTENATKTVFGGKNVTLPAANATAVNETEPVKTQSSCVTRDDDRATSFFVETAPVGSACVFGVDARDEGSHCIPETEFGSNGWCYTEDDMSAWGSCSDGCPLYGQHGSLANKIDGIQQKLGKLSDTIDQLAGASENAKNESASMA